ncbi:Probable serine/threonine-protein kinase PBL5 [Linum perenne]
MRLKKMGREELTTTNTSQSKRVVVIQDALSEVNPLAIMWVLHGLSLNPGDSLTLLPVLHRFNNSLGYRAKVGSSTSGANNEAVVREAARKKAEFDTNVDLMHISKMFESHKVVFKIEVAVGCSAKRVALERAENLKATWVVLDRSGQLQFSLKRLYRQMKRHRKFFLYNLSCGISRMKRNNVVKQLRGPNKAVSNLQSAHDQKASHKHIPLTYDEMLPETLEEEDDLFSLELPPPLVQKETDISISNKQVLEEWQAEAVFQCSVCTVCKTRRALPIDPKDASFGYKVIQAATDDFSSSNFMSKDAKGSTFRGQLKSSNLKIIVKQWESSVTLNGNVKFSFETNILRTVRHNNVLMLMGCCSQGSLRMLVYEYACNSTLDQHLSKHCPLPLAWSDRMKVALGAAKGLNYLHENNIVHRHVKTSSVFLTHDFEPMLGDYGVLETADSEDSTEQKQDPESLVYSAPECQTGSKLSATTDVYAFGVVLLELITGQSATEGVEIGLSRKTGLVGWARPILRERTHFQLIDTRIVRAHDGEQLYWMCRLIHKCLAQTPKKRLTMNEVVSALECIAERRENSILDDVLAVRSSLSHPSAFETSDDTMWTEENLSKDTTDWEMSKEQSNRTSHSAKILTSSFFSGTGSVEMRTMGRPSLVYSEMLD